MIKRMSTTKNIAVIIAGLFILALAALAALWPLWLIILGLLAYLKL